MNSARTGRSKAHCGNLFPFCDARNGYSRSRGGPCCDKAYRGKTPGFCRRFRSRTDGPGHPCAAGETSGAEVARSASASAPKRQDRAAAPATFRIRQRGDGHPVLFAEHPDRKPRSGEGGRPSGKRIRQDSPAAGTKSSPGARRTGLDRHPIRPMPLRPPPRRRRPHNRHALAMARDRVLAPAAPSGGSGRRHRGSCSFRCTTSITKRDRTLFMGMMSESRR